MPVQPSTARVLTDLKKLKVAGEWLLLGSTAASALVPRVWRGTYPSKAAWIVEMARSTGYSAATLRRQIKIWVFLSEKLSSAKLRVLKGNNVSMAAVEVLMRMNDIEPDRAKQLFQRTLDGKLSYRELLKIYSGLTRASEGKNATAKRSHINIEADLLKPHPEIFPGLTGFQLLADPATSIPTFEFSLPAVVAVSIDHNDSRRVFGFDVVGTSQQDSLQSVLDRISFMSSFFSEYWVFVMEGRDRPIPQGLISRLPLLGRPSIGLIVVAKANAASSTERYRLNVKIRPHGRPSPDLEHLLLKHLMSDAHPAIAWK